MSDLRTAAQQALEAMQTNAYAVANEAPHRDVMAYYEAIAALKAALKQQEQDTFCDSHCTWRDHHPECVRAEQPEHEPYAWMSIGGSIWRRKTTEDDVPLYTRPYRREWRGLTEEEIYPLYSEPSSDAEMVEFARAIEAALRSKNYD